MNGMKKLVRSSLSCLLTLLPMVMACQSSASDQQTAPQTFIAGLSGDYLGQAPPGTALRRFASGIVPEDMYHSVTVSPDGREIYWADRHRGIMVTRRMDDRWTTPALVSFSGRLVSGGQSEDDAPVVSPDNTRLFFNSLRSYRPGVTGWHFWYSERTASGWSAPQPMPEVVNSTGGIHWQTSVAASGTFYFGVFSTTGGVARTSIYYSGLVNGSYAAPEPLTAVNSVAQAVCPFIAPDESYIIFNKLAADGQMPEGYYISFKGSDGQWLAPQRLSQLPAGEESSFVTRDGRYVFSKAYWASTQIIEDLRPGGRR